MEIKKELIKRDIAGDTVLVPVGKTVMENNGLFILNELGAFIWDMLPELGSEEGCGIGGASGIRYRRGHRAVRYSGIF